MGNDDIGGGSAQASKMGPVMGVAIVTFQSAEIVGDCLASLAASLSARFKVVVLDNASSDGTLAAIRNWANTQPAGFTFEEAELGSISEARADLTVLRSPVNGGFAYGTNHCLKLLLADPALDLFWLLNPDARARPDAARHYIAAASEGPFGLLGGRTVFADDPHIIQTDGGRVSRWTGTCTSVNRGEDAAQVAMPEADTLDYCTGANMVVSRLFVDRCGLMPEDYFLFYEEVEWALRRGNLALRVVPLAIVEHLGGTSIGTGIVGRRSSPFAQYFSFRGRVRFLRRCFPASVPLGIVYGLLKAAQLLTVNRAPVEAWAVLAGSLGLAPPASVRRRLDPAAQALAFGRTAR